ncbi:MAG: TSUP family transporter [Candidatus Sericytochromatia bacterium]|nr:TSUP family transporter [Candidatus Tanganyikabacteria bacterium]
MALALVAFVALVASILTFYSGFGLGTLLLPAMAAFMPVEAAVAATAVVHMANNAAKGALLLKRADWSVVWRFGLPAIAAAWLGARALVILGALPAVGAWEAAGRTFAIMPVKLVVAMLLAAFAILELVPLLERIRYSPVWLPIGGVLSGFFGGLSGFQGAFRSAVLVKAGMPKEAFLGTGIAIALAVDLTRLSGYFWQPGASPLAKLEGGLTPVLVGVAAALAGTLVGNRLLGKVTLPAIQKLVTAMLLVFAAALAAGLV